MPFRIVATTKVNLTLPPTSFHSDIVQKADYYELKEWITPVTGPPRNTGGTIGNPLRRLRLTSLLDAVVALHDEIVIIVAVLETQQ